MKDGHQGQPSRTVCRTVSRTAMKDRDGEDRRLWGWKMVGIEGRRDGQ